MAGKLHIRIRLNFYREKVEHAQPQCGFASVAAEESGTKLRGRAESFADHYSQARLFWRSMSEPEQRHIASAFAFELGKVETIAVRRRMLGHLALVDGDLVKRVGQKLGMEGQAESIEPARQPIAMDPSPALSLVQKAPKTLAGRTVGVLVSNGSDRGLVECLTTAVEKEGARLEIIAPKIGGSVAADGKAILADHALAAGPSILFDAVVVAAAGEGVEALLAHPNAIDWVRDAFAHLKVIGYVADAERLLDRAGVEHDEGVVALQRGNSLAAFVAAAKAGRVWERERTIEERSESGSRPPRAR